MKDQEKTKIELDASKLVGFEAAPNGEQQTESQIQAKVGSKDGKKPINLQAKVGVKPGRKVRPDRAIQAKVGSKRGGKRRT